jgi:hypothetical protein
MLPAMIVVGFVVAIVLVWVFLIVTRRAFFVFFWFDWDLWWHGPLRPLTFVFVVIALVMAAIIALAQRGEFASP